MRLSRIQLLASAGLTGGLAFLMPAGAGAETLNQALSSAYSYNPQLDAQRAALRATDEQVAIAKSGYRPTVTANGDINVVETAINPKPPARGDLGGGAGTTWPAGYSINAVQPLFKGLAVVNEVRAAEASVRAGRETLRDTERTVLLAAATAYMDVVRDQAIVKLRENNVQVLSRELKATQDRFGVGEVTRTDVAQAEARRAGAVAQLDLARANLKTSRATYEQIIGHPPSSVAEPGSPDRLLPKSLEEAVGTGARENPLVLAALYNEEASRYQVDQIRGGLLPQVQVEANYSDRFGTSQAIDETRTATVTGRFSVPLYEAGRVSAQVRQAKHTHISRLQSIEVARTQVQQAVVSSWSQLQAARAAVQSDLSQVKANQTALAGVREEERVGQRTLLDVLNAEQELLNAQVNLETDKRNLVVAGYTVLSQIGRLDAATLSVASNVYDPEIHYEEVRRKWWGISITHGDGRREFLDLWPTRVEREPTK
jgi:outer membrane protein